MAQQLGERVVIAEPLSLGIEGNDERVLPRQLSEQPLGIWVSRHRRTQRPRESFED
jgi:hypothetical protein